MFPGSKSGGKIRLSTPDIHRLLALYTAEPSDLQKRYVDWINRQFIGHSRGYTPTLILNNLFYNWGHRFIYDQNILAAILTQAGFTGLATFPVGESPDPHLTGIEKHGETVGQPELNAYETMVIEATKP